MSGIAKSLCTGCSCAGNGRLNGGVMTGNTTQVAGHGFSGTNSSILAAKGQYAGNAALIQPQMGGSPGPSSGNSYTTKMQPGAGVNGTTLNTTKGLPFNFVKQSNAGLGGKGPKGYSPFFSSKAKTLKGGRGKKGYSHPKKGRASRTKKGRKNFTTKKGNKYYNRRGHRQKRAQKSRKVRNTYKKSVGLGNKYSNHMGYRHNYAKSRKARLPYQMGGSSPFPSNDNMMLPAGNPSLNTKAPSGFNTNKGYTINPDSGVGGMFANPIPINGYKTCSTMT